ncbi:MAG: hypothetical protein SOZ90_00760 [Candidatus Faecousia sp.]|nr:hypothetical protein [Candidatus Faecousia sp.]
MEITLINGKKICYPYYIAKQRNFNCLQPELTDCLRMEILKKRKMLLAKLGKYDTIGQNSLKGVCPHGAETEETDEAGVGDCPGGNFQRLGADGDAHCLHSLL